MLSTFLVFRWLFAVATNIILSRIVIAVFIIAANGPRLGDSAGQKWTKVQFCTDGSQCCEPLAKLRKKSMRTALAE